MPTPNEPVRLDLYDSLALLKLAARDPGQYEVKLGVRGNSILSTLFVSDGDPSQLLIQYLDSGVGEEAGEATLVGQHRTATLLQSDKIIVTLMHNKPRLVVTVSGSAPVTFGVYATVVSQFASDTDSALVRDAEPVGDITTRNGFVFATYDPSQQKFFFLRANNGALSVDVEGGGVGKVLFDDGILDDVDEDTEIIVLSRAVPAGKTWRVRTADVACSGMGTWKIYLNGAVIGGGATGNGTDHDTYLMPLFVTALALSTVEIRYTYTYGPADMPIEAFIGVTEV